MKKLHPNQCIGLFSAVFLLVYTVVVGTRYHATLRMIEANSWIDNYILHLFRWPYLGALLMAVFVLGVPLVFWFLYNLRPFRMKIKWWIVVPFTLFMAWMCPPKQDGERYKLFSQQMNVGEQFYRYMFMADEGRWLELLNQIRKDGTRETPIGMRYSLLAESALGTLPQTLFTYPVRTPEDFLMRGERNPISCEFNRLFYHNLGVFDEAFHQAMEYGLLQKEGCCMRTLRFLADYALKEHDWAVAEKYLDILDQVYFEKEFVMQGRTILAEGREVERKEQMAASAGQNVLSESKPLREDNFVGSYPLRSEMVRLAYYKVGDDQKTVDYMLLSILMQKQLGQFYSVLQQFPNYQGRELPQPYREALQILQSDETALRDAPSGSYAYFYYNVQIPEEAEIQMSSMQN